MTARPPGVVLAGLDIGGSAIKAGLADIDDGLLLGGLHSVPTPQPATPDAVIAACADLAKTLDADGPVGVGMPSVIQRGIVRTAANIDPAWIGCEGARRMSEALARPVVLLNDADAAGLAEMRWGAGRNTSGVVIMLTFGTGIGTALFNDGVLLPNTELGHLTLRGMDAEHWASARVRTAEKLDFAHWVERVNDYLAEMHRLFWPDVFILGGAVSARFAEFGPLLRSAAELRPAHFAGQAGVLGAALAASGHGMARRS
ncbi:MAG: ROK family protein [Gammaproteobacteria bacterium]|nr:ROK family protein [Gammaproteobacteria bacterium]